MANITINDASLTTMLPGDVAEDDVVAVWDTSAGQMKKATRRVAVGSKITGDKNLVAAADGTLAVLEVAQTFLARQTFGSGIGSGNAATIADDAATSFALQGSYGIIALLASFTTCAGLFAYRSSGGTLAQLAVATGSLIELRTDQPLTGTTGTDGKVTLSLNSADSKIYIENRSGSSKVMGVIFLAL